MAAGQHTTPSPSTATHAEPSGGGSWLSSIGRRGVFAAAPAAAAAIAVGQSVGAPAGPMPRPAAGGLAALAASLGEIEPPGENDDVEMEHLDRMDVIVAAAPRLRVRSAADAALALSAAVRSIADMAEHALSPGEHMARIETAIGALSRLGAWMAEDLAAPPMRTVWPPSVSPFAKQANGAGDAA